MVPGFFADETFLNFLLFLSALIRADPRLAFFYRVSRCCPYYGRMRVIAGTYRSRQLTAPSGTGTRPTSDRLRETLFNILTPRLPGCRFADLYAGTGAVGIEAISRGAGHVFFAERAAPALGALRANLASLKIASGFTVEERGTGALLERLAKRASEAARSTELLDLVYLDPPWEAEAEYAATLQLLGSTRGTRALSPSALVIAEHSSKAPLAPRYGSLEQTRTLKQGDAALTFFALPMPTAALESAADMRSGS